MQLFLISQIESHPFKSSWKVEWVIANFRQLSMLYWSILIGNIIASKVMDWLLIPKLMLPGKLHPVYKSLSLESIEGFICFKLILAEFHKLHALHVIHLLLAGRQVASLAPTSLGLNWFVCHWCDCSFFGFLHN